MLTPRDALIIHVGEQPLPALSTQDASDEIINQEPSSLGGDPAQTQLKKNWARLQGWEVNEARTLQFGVQLTNILFIIITF